MQLKEDNIVNCLGFASKTIFQDKDVYAVKGHILEFENPTDFNFMCHRFAFKGRLVEFYGHGGHGSRLMIGKSEDEGEEDFTINEKTLNDVYETALEFKRYYETPSSKL